MGEPDDAELARRILGAAPDRAKEAEAQLMARLAPRIRLYGLRHLRDEAMAQDLVQEVLLVTLEALREGRVREPERIGSFVLGTCRLVAGNLRRGQRRRERLLATFGDTLAPAPAPGPALDRERATIVLTFYADAGADEIAAELAMSPGNVRVVRHRALARLLACLEGA